MKKEIFISESMGESRIAIVEDSTLVEVYVEKQDQQRMVGNIYKVLVDKTGDSLSVGRTEFDSPEIDNIVHIKGVVEKGEFVDVKIESSNEFELIGTPV